MGYSGAQAFSGEVFATTGYVGFGSPFVTITDPKTGDRTATENWKGSPEWRGAQQRHAGGSGFAGA